MAFIMELSRTVDCLVQSSKEEMAQKAGEGASERELQDIQLRLGRKALMLQDVWSENGVPGVVEIGERTPLLLRVLEAGTLLRESVTGQKRCFGDGISDPIKRDFAVFRDRIAAPLGRDLLELQPQRGLVEQGR